MANPQLLSGARGLIQRFNATTQEFETIAFSTDITINIREGTRQTYVVGRMNPAVIDTLSYDVDVAVGRVVPVNAPDAAATDATVTGRPETATAIGIGLEQVIAQIVTANDINIAIQDKVTGLYSSSVHGCRFSGRTFSMNAGDVANERLNFVGIYDSGNNNENSATDGYGL